MAFVPQSRMVHRIDAARRNVRWHSGKLRGVTRRSEQWRCVTLPAVIGAAQPRKSSKTMALEQLPDLVTEPDDDVLGMDLDTDEPPLAASKYIETGGKKFLKSSVVASLSSNRTKKVTMRTLRAQGVALEDLQKRKTQELDLLNLAEEDVMKAGDLAATQFQSGQYICLAVLMVKGFRLGKDKTIRNVIEMDELANEASNIRVVARVMEFENPRTTASVISPEQNFWEWTGKFIMLDLDAISTRMIRNQLILEVPSIIVHSLGPTVAARTSLNRASMESALKRPTWRIDSEQLEEDGEKVG
ncbi:hypothetical protein B0H14DRAFT_2585108 [Mycena olivaceomarginata]|nr:hypothetical protein B0H14DRAFT_2585108 [Mycena olivaceomarginata]